MGNPPHITLRVREMKEFGAVLECMDGRPMRKVADYLSTSFGVRYIDTITTAGTVKHLANDTEQTGTLLANLAVSVDKHGSSQIAIVAHHDCAGNPVSSRAQRQEIVAAVDRISSLYPDADVIGLWLGENWIIEKVIKV